MVVVSGPKLIDELCKAPADQLSFLEATNEASDWNSARSADRYSRIVSVDGANEVHDGLGAAHRPVPHTSHPLSTHAEDERPIS